MFSEKNLVYLGIRRKLIGKSYKWRKSHRKQLIGGPKAGFSELFYGDSNFNLVKLLRPLKDIIKMDKLSSELYNLGRNAEHALFER